MIALKLLMALSGWLAAGAVVALIQRRFAFGPWLLQCLVALDQLINVLITPFNRGAYADESLSSRAHRAEIAGTLWGQIWRPVIDCIFFWQRNPGHCARAYWAEIKRAQQPPEIRG